MDKNIIKKHLSEKFLSEEATPGISMNNKIRKDNAKINKKGVADIAKDSLEYNKELKQDKDTSKMAPNKINYANDEQKTYHDEFEIMNGQEMVQYDNEPTDLFKERAIEAIEGSARMGNQGGIGNAEATWGASDDDFGKNLVKNVKSSIKKRNNQTPTTKMYGNDWEVVQDMGSKPRAIQEMAESPKKPISDKNKMVITNWVEKFGSDGAAEKLVNALSSTGMVSDLPDSMEYGQGVNKISAFLEKKDFDNAFYKAKTLATKLEKKAMRDMGMFENKKDNNNTQIKESMKRLRFKNEFKGLGNALKLIPEGYKVDNKVFEMTDGNETYKIRWEGNLSEGKAVVLTAADSKLVNEDITRMKELFGYKSHETLGLVKGNARIDENKAFTDVWNKTKQLMTESDDIESTNTDEGYWEEETKKAPEANKHIQGSTSTDKGTKSPKPKEGDLDDVVSHAAEAKKHIEGSVSTDKGTQAPKPKEGNWEDAGVTQAPEATKHVHLKESEEIEEAEMETEGYDIMKEEPMDVTEMMDKMMKEEEKEELPTPPTPEEERANQVYESEKEEEA